MSESSYYNCPRCALSIRVRAEFLAMRNCPRCMARAHLTVPLYETPEPVRPSLFRRGPGADGRDVTPS
ncbi:MAG: hypothetical protein QOJ07_1047 [Thermoleophilaceae bacterium]|nr:hypothetical protein [Thermoleophilaceae bacterium]